MPSYKIIQSGHITEVYRYSGSFALKLECEEWNSRKGGRDKDGQESRKDEYKASVNYKAREKVRRLINANFNNQSAFITLTFAKNMQDIDKANYEFKKWQQKMKRKIDFKFVGVIEFQERGAIHYHLICNLDYDKKKLKNRKWRQEKERELARTWGIKYKVQKGDTLESIAEQFGRKKRFLYIMNEFKLPIENKMYYIPHGVVDIGYKDSDNQGAYLFGYFTKEQSDPRLEGKKRYFFSRGNLKQPEQPTGRKAGEILKRLENEIPVFTSYYENEFIGKVDYMEYNPERYNNDYIVDKAYEFFEPGLIEVV